jgi:antitoxin component of MazEF toxin-antitoxin module
MTTTITMKNQVTLPASIVAQAGLAAGFRLEWSLAKNGELRAKPVPPLEQVVKSLRGRGKKFLPKGRSAVADLIEDRSNEA